MSLLKCLNPGFTHYLIIGGVFLNNEFWFVIIIISFLNGFLCVFFTYDFIFLVDKLPKKLE